jgi:hypothetical protein
VCSQVCFKAGQHQVWAEISYNTTFVQEGAGSEASLVDHPARTALDRSL